MKKYNYFYIFGTIITAIVVYLIYMNYNTNILDEVYKEQKIKEDILCKRTKFLNDSLKNADGNKIMGNLFFGMDSISYNTEIEEITKNDRGIYIADVLFQFEKPDFYKNKLYGLNLYHPHEYNINGHIKYDHPNGGGDSYSQMISDLTNVAEFINKKYQIVEINKIEKEINPFL